MAWQEILGHDRVVEQFRRALQRNRLASTFLFIGPEGIGKRTFAWKLAQAFLCENIPEQHLEPCGECPACQQVVAGTHPDVDFVRKPDDAAFLPLELLIGDDQHRMQEGLCYNIALKPYSNKRRIAIIDDADYFRVEAANCLLKTLEEPPPKSIIILLGTSEQRQLPTIRSRCQIIRFNALTSQDIAQLLVQQGVVSSVPQAESLAIRANGSLTQAIELMENDFEEFRTDFLTFLASREADHKEIIARIIQLISKSKEVEKKSKLKSKADEDDEITFSNREKRNRLKRVLGISIEFYRRLLQVLAENVPLNASQLDQAVAKAARWWQQQPEWVATCLELTLQMQEAVDANAQAPNILEYWVDELQSITRFGRYTPLLSIA
jgi:DNA polymerase III subunit delta'